MGAPAGHPPPAAPTPSPGQRQCCKARGWLRPVVPRRPGVSGPAPHSLGCRQDPWFRSWRCLRMCGAGRGLLVTPRPQKAGGSGPRGEPAGVPASCAVHSQQWCWGGTPVRYAVLPLMCAFLDQGVWAAWMWQSPRLCAGLLPEQVVGWQQSPLGSWWGLLLGGVLGERRFLQCPPAVVLGQPRGHGWASSEPPACGLTAAFAFRSPHYACPEVIRVSSQSLRAPVPACPRGLTPPSRTPDPPPGPLILPEANHTAPRREKSTTGARRTCGAAG